MEETTSKEIDMSDDKSKSQGQDRQRINVNQDYELRDWSKKFGVTPEELKRAVAKVGDRATDVERELKAK
jgi:hypothetical protein